MNDTVDLNTEELSASLLLSQENNKTQNTESRSVLLHDKNVIKN